MITSLNLSEIKFDDVPNTSETDNYWYAIFLHFSLGRYFYVKIVIHRFRKIFREIDKIFHEINQVDAPIELDKYNFLIDFLDSLIDHNHLAKKDFLESKLFNASQKNDFNVLFKSFMKKAIKTKAVLSKKFYSDKKKNNDSDLFNLVVSNNNIELQKLLHK
ncbi:hypothetical protein [Chryseobacterium sp.]|uniref:hypothetical protein n=1 Tax=Chryseobacterium sp. TaxID=1871047 RepID=UPI000EDF81A8|nr:hypothetical protein [Chryseobacterium sp.]HCA07456.1 hypothetical protein [Chryseobacterium sp.]